MRHKMVLLIALALAACATNTPVSTGQKFPVFFAALSSKLDDDGTAAVSAAAAWARKYPNQPITVIGYADPRIADPANAELAHQRALAVKAQLETDGVADNRVTLGTGDAELLPLAAQGARRVDVSIGDN